MSVRMKVMLMLMIEVALGDGGVNMCRYLLFLSTEHLVPANPTTKQDNSV
jgi:hypothetical protein